MHLQRGAVFNWQHDKPRPGNIRFAVNLHLLGLAATVGAHQGAANYAAKRSFPIDRWPRRQGYYWDKFFGQMEQSSICARRKRHLPKAPSYRERVAHLSICKLREIPRLARLCKGYAGWFGYG